MPVMLGAVDPGVALAVLGVAIPSVLEEVILGLYIGLLTGVFPALIAFVFGFGFKYLTNVTVPGLGVVVLAGAIAGISGGLLGVLSPEIASSWTGITAVVVILMAALWAHGIGDTLAAKTPRASTLQRIKETRLSADLVDRVDGLGQIQIQAHGDIHDIEGYPPLPDDIHQSLRQGSWKFPATLPVREIEERLEARLADEFELAEVEVHVNRQGHARIAAAPTTAGLSRRLPPTKRAVSINTLLPTGLAREDVCSLVLEDGTVSGSVVSARTAGAAEESPELPADTHEIVDADEDSAPIVPPKAPRTTGGEGRVTLALDLPAVRRVIAESFAPLIVHARGTGREYEAIALLTGYGNRFRKLTVGATSSLVGQSIVESGLLGAPGIVVLTLHRGADIRVAPTPETVLEPGDELIIAGSRTATQAATEVTT